ncbi:Manganese-dependent ADP-ribose/CDP-alcohol diphosphatase [Quillaja saponaria]|uniref:Manganese-dependent ADP-ribose/CDP-alcohol diphosphatase n=1 Tax=Quillaja saponaria TaxID=32244 RepID=A0AAD7PHU0_QUISA|nr:Manganese-dependent ADP-ribose/CDP-alcohol diphosphatase [Quillaja saponaria]
MASANGMLIAQGKQPLFSFGLISDVQYADIPDARSFLGVPRYYQHSILVLERAVQRWNDHQKLRFAINLGDIVDGYCPKNQSLNTVKKVVDVFQKFRGPIYHMIGNHCLYNLPRSKLLPLLTIQSPDGHAYYNFSPVPEFRFVVLDAYDISAIGWPRDHPSTLEALKFLQEKNPNQDKNSPEGLVGLERRFLMFNGGVGKQQMEWLDKVLHEAAKLKQKVVVCCHLPLDPGASRKEGLLWNYDEVMDVIHRYNCVKVCLAGHDHKGGYSVDSHGVHHRVLEAALECPPGTDAYGYVDVYDDRVSLLGTDRMDSTDMYFNPQLDLLTRLLRDGRKQHSIICIGVSCFTFF